MLNEHLSEGLVMGPSHFTDKDGNHHPNNCIYPIANLAAGKPTLRHILKIAREKGLFTADFTAIMAKAHTIKQLQTGYAETDDDNWPVIASALFGDTKPVEEVTKGIGLYR